jgi:hypothetical protein
MPIKKGKSKSTTKSSIKSNNNKTIVDIIKTLLRPNQNFRKSQNNLPARLMKLNSPNHKVQHYKNTHLSNKENLLTTNTQILSKSMSSSYSSFTENGKTHSEGKEIINNSTKPFIEVTEMENGKTERFMIPKNTIPYKSIKSKSMKSKTIKSKAKSKSTKGKAKSTKGKSKSTKGKAKSTKGKAKSTKAKSTKRK